MEKIRLQKYMSDAGVMSRRAAEKEIEAGTITVNGEPAELGQKIDPEHDEVRYAGRRVYLPDNVEKKTYIVLNKPRGFVTTLSDEKGRRNVAELVTDCAVRVYPIGRLDMDSEGLLLLTNDGDFANYLMHPKHEIEKVYEVWVTGFQTGGEVLLRSPIPRDGYTIRPPKVTLLSRDQDKAVLSVTIHEGRNRQVRRMCAMAGMEVKRLIRIQEGYLKLGDLPRGKWRYLTCAEVDALQK